MAARRVGKGINCQGGIGVTAFTPALALCWGEGRLINNTPRVQPLPGGQETAPAPPPPPRPRPPGENGKFEDYIVFSAELGLHPYNPPRPRGWLACGHPGGPAHHEWPGFAPRCGPWRQWAQGPN